MFSGPDDIGGSLEGERKVSDIRRPNGFSGDVGQRLFRSHEEEFMANGTKNEHQGGALQEPRLSDGNRKTPDARVCARGYDTVLFSIYPGIGVLQIQRRIAGKIHRRVQTSVHQPPETQRLVRANILPQSVELSRHYRVGSLRMRASGLPMASVVGLRDHLKCPSKPLSELRIIFIS